MPIKESNSSQHSLPQPGDIVKIWPYGSKGYNNLVNSLEEYFLILIKKSPDNIFKPFNYDLLQSNVTNWYPGSYSDQRIRSVHQRGKYQDFKHFIRVIGTLGTPDGVEWEIQ